MRGRVRHSGASSEGRDLLKRPVRSKPWRWGFNQLEQVLLHDRESERGNQLINPHAADLCLQEELSDRHLIKG
jgi:hypothetical protein